jgi:hypothetical protein
MFVVCLTTRFQWLRRCSVECRDDKWMMNWKGYGRKRSWPNLRHYLSMFPEGLIKIHEKFQPGYPVSGPRFEPGTSRIWNTSVNYSITTFGKSCNRIHNLHNEERNNLFVSLIAICDKVVDRCGQVVSTPASYSRDLGSNLGPQTGYPERGFCDFL